MKSVWVVLYQILESLVQQKTFSIIYFEIHTPPPPLSGYFFLTSSTPPNMGDEIFLPRTKLLCVFWRGLPGQIVLGKRRRDGERIAQTVSSELLEIWNRGVYYPQFHMDGTLKWVLFRNANA